MKEIKSVNINKMAILTFSYNPIRNKAIQYNITEEDIKNYGFLNPTYRRKNENTNNK